MAALLQRRRLQMGIQVAALAIDCAQVKSMASDDSLSASTKSPTDDYDFLNVIGQGTTSCVRLAQRKSDGLKVALKSMRSNDCEMHKFAQEEYNVLKRLNHPNIIHVMDFFTVPSQAVTVMEWFEGMELSEAIEEMPEERIPEMVARELSRVLFGAVDYLHKRGVVHRDIKPQNVLVDKSFTALKLVDFNTACQLEASLGLTPTGSRMYAAPEVLLGESPSEQSDIWGAGLCTHLMLCGRLPQRRDLLWGESPCNIAVREITFTSSRWRRISPGCKDVLSRSLAIELCNRPNAEVVLGLPWFIDVDSTRVWDPVSDGESLPSSPVIVKKKKSKKSTASKMMQAVTSRLSLEAAQEAARRHSEQQQQQQQLLQQQLQVEGKDPEVEEDAGNGSHSNCDHYEFVGLPLMGRARSEFVSDINENNQSSDEEEDDDEAEEIPMVRMQATRGTRRPSICLSPGGKELVVYESMAETDEPPMSLSASCVIIDDDDESED